jgi:hypothetical protein
MNLVPPPAVAAEAEKALEWRREFGRGGTMVGVARARDLANRKELSPETIRRMVSFFARHEVDKQGKGFFADSEGYPSAGRIAWGLWGGDPGRTWAEKMVRQMERNEGAEMIDVNVLAGAAVRRIDGKYGEIKRVSPPWVTVEWQDGTSESFLRSDDALREDFEIKTLNAGWIPMVQLLGINEKKVAPAATDDQGQEELPADETEEEEGENDDAADSDTDEDDEEDEMDEEKSFRELVSELRDLMTPPRAIYEATEKAKSRAKALLGKGKGKEKKSAKKPVTGGGGPGEKPQSPFYNYAKIGNNSPSKKKRSYKGIWKCSGTEDEQVCVAQKDVPAQGIKKGQEKIVRKWKGKAAYTAKYEKGRKDGKYKLPNGAVAPVGHPHYTPTGAT